MTLPLADDMGLLVAAFMTSDTMSRSSSNNPRSPLANVGYFLKYEWCRHPFHSSHELNKAYQDHGEMSVASLIALVI